MERIYRTFQDKEVTEETIDHQHLSNIIWYWTVVMNYPIESMREDLKLLRRRFNGQLLPYRPHVDFEYEIAFLRSKCMLHKDPNNACRIIIVGEDKEIGEILYSNPQAVNFVLGSQKLANDKMNYRREYDPTESKQYHISFDVIRQYYKNNPKMQETLRTMFDIALNGIDEEIAAEKRAKEKPMYAIGTLLRRKNHPLNVYTIQKDHLGNYGIYNITHGQWWGNTIPANKMSLLNRYSPNDSKKYISQDELAIMCGSHNPDNFYSFDEANSLIKK